MCLPMKASMSKTMTTVNMVLFVLELSLLAYFTSQIYIEHFDQFLILLPTIVVPHIIVNGVSGLLILGTMDFNGQRLGGGLCVLMHVLQFGILWRYLKIILLFTEQDLKELFCLRFGQAIFQSVPLLIVQLYFYLNYAWMDTIYISILLITLTSAAFGTVAFQISSRSARSKNDDIDTASTRTKEYLGVICVTAGTALLIFSRCGSICLMWSAQSYWTLLILGLHFLIHFTVSLVHHRLNKTTLGVRRILAKFALSVVSIVDNVERKTGWTRCSHVAYFSLIIAENIVMTAIWMTSSANSYVFKMATVVVILLTFVFGLILRFAAWKHLLHGIGSDSRVLNDENGKYIKTISSVVQEDSGHFCPTLSTTSDVFVRDAQFRESSMFDNPILAHPPGHQFHQISSLKSTKQCRTINDHCVTGIDSNPSNATPSKSEIFTTSNCDMYSPSMVHPREINFDISSSNSRNTNTMNFCSICSGNMSNCVSSNSINHSFKSDKTLCKHCQKNLYPIEDELQRFSEGNVNGNEVSDKVSSSMKRPCVERQCLPGETQVNCTENSTYSSTECTSFTEYHSFSGESDTSDWSSETSQSEYALTWPPTPFKYKDAQPLPREKLTTNENIARWFEMNKGYNDNELEEHNEEMSKFRRKPNNLKLWFKRLSQKDSKTKAKCKKNDGNAHTILTVHTWHAPRTYKHKVSKDNRKKTDLCGATIESLV